jgi:hypothetical protein
MLSFQDSVFNVFNTTGIMNEHELLEVDLYGNNTYLLYFEDIFFNVNTTGTTNELEPLEVDLYGNVTYAIFYHAFVNPNNVTHSLGIIIEQLDQWQASRYRNATLYYTHLGDASVAFPCPHTGDCQLLAQKPTGWEMETLFKLQEYCQEHPDHHVIYLHSKGSFHPSESNDRLRNLLTLAALSPQCYQGLVATKCNICSARFSPLPHWHTPGNMWTAKCNYVEQLYPITNFEDKMSEVVDTIITTTCTDCYAWALGCDRFSSEHWVHTHPEVYPCDVLTNQQFMYGYDNLDDVIPPFSLERAPRTFLNVTSHLKGLPMEQTRLTYRLKELYLLYNDIPGPNSFAWKWYQENHIL